MEKFLSQHEAQFISWRIYAPLAVKLLTKLAREQEATYHSPHANMVTMAPSPLVQKIMSKHDEDMGRICKKNIRVQLGLLCVDSMQRTIKSTYIHLKNTPFVSRHADQLHVDN